jgi:hypothetical protein
MSENIWAKNRTQDFRAVTEIEWGFNTFYKAIFLLYFPLALSFVFLGDVTCCVGTTSGWEDVKFNELEDADIFIPPEAVILASLASASEAITYRV